MSELNKFSEEVLDKFSKKITDKVFLMIQNDKELMSKYLKLVESKGLQVVNQQIGKKVKMRYKLNNDINRNESPESTLIKTYQEFE